MKTTLQRIGLTAIFIAGATAAMADDATNQKIIDYYKRKANLPPEVTATVVEVTDSKIPGAKQGKLNLSRGGQAIAPGPGLSRMDRTGENGPEFSPGDLERRPFHLLRRLRDDVHDPIEGVVPVQGRCRALEYFDPLNRGQRHRQEFPERQAGLVDIDGSAIDQDQ